MVVSGAPEARQSVALAVLAAAPAAHARGRRGDVGELAARRAPRRATLTGMVTNETDSAANADGQRAR